MDMRVLLLLLIAALVLPWVLRMWGPSRARGASDDGRWQQERQALLERLDQLETRVQALETVITDDEWQLKRKFRDLGE